MRRALLVTLLAALGGCYLFSDEPKARKLPKGHPMRDAVDWMSRYRQLWNERLDALADLVEDTEES